MSMSPMSVANISLHTAWCPLSWGVFKKLLAISKRFIRRVRKEMGNCRNKSAFNSNKSALS